MNEWYQGPGSEVLDADPRVTMFRSADRCFATLRAWLDWHDWSKKPTSFRRSDAAATATARYILAQATGPGVALSESDSKRVLAAYGVRTPGEAIARDADEAAAAAARIGFPVAVKISSPDILHKTEIGGIRLSLRTEQEVRDATREILGSARKHMPDARIAGVSVQQMLSSGVEIVVGVKRDQQFGPLIAVGMGGVMVELLKDTAVCLAPVSEETARSMVRSLQGHKLLAGYRGAAAVDEDGLVDAICRLSELADDLKDVVAEIDVNPIIVTASGAIAADALIVSQH
jgi:acetyltransferase